MLIKIFDVVESKVFCDISHAEMLRELLSYEHKGWFFNPRLQKSVQKTSQKSFLENKKFYSGFIPRITEHLKREKINYRIVDDSEKMNPIGGPKLNLPKGKSINKAQWDEEVKLVSSFLKIQKGIIVAPTGIGKTFIAAMIISCYKNPSVLFIVDTKTLLKQTEKEFIQLLNLKPKDLKTVGDKKVDFNARIVITTRQTFAKLDPYLYGDKFDIVIVDECHEFASQNRKILESILSPVRLGLTATMPPEKYKRLLIEGLIGPVVGELTLEEGIKGGMLAKPILKLYKTDFHEGVHDCRRWRDAYKLGIVENVSRNKQIAKIAMSFAANNKTSLIFVKEIAHGNHIIEAAGEMDLKMIWGNTLSEDREKARQEIIQKKIKCLVVSSVWKKGVNIPSLDVVINAAGYKYDNAVLQMIGRGLRRTEDKEELIIVDFFDPSHHSLINHFGHRLSLYFEKGWM